MSAAVFQFPTPADVPVMQRGRRSKLPVGVQSIQAYRLEHQKKLEEQTAANIERVKSQCYETLKRVFDGEVTAIAIIEARGKEPCHAFAAGAFQDDYEFLKREVDWLAQAVSESLAEKAHS